MKTTTKTKNYKYVHDRQRDRHIRKVTIAVLPSWTWTT